MVSVTDPYVRILVFLDRSRYVSIKQLLSCTHEAGWTPFQTHYFSENLVVPGIWSFILLAVLCCCRGTIRARVLCCAIKGHYLPNC
jgi:hypothetical protein